MEQPISKPRVLIVDDVQNNIKVLGESLLPDYDIRFATSGFQALDMATAFPPPDLILLDILMPGMDGYEVCRRLKRGLETKHIPVIFLTAKTDSLDEIRGFDLGAEDYITKPFNPRIVQSRVKTHLELKRHRDKLNGLVKARTAELEEANLRLREEIERTQKMTQALQRREQELALQTRNLEEANIALKVVLDQIRTSRQEQEERIIDNVNALVMPYLERVRDGVKDERLQTYLGLMQAQLESILTPFAATLAKPGTTLTRTEIEVADLVRNDKSTKEIAALLNVSEKTVEFHRNNLREKLDIRNKKINLKHHLLSLDQS